MGMVFEELDAITRGYMLRDFDDEQASLNPYRSRALSPAGLLVVPGLIRVALDAGTDETLIEALTRTDLWNRSESYVRDGVIRERDVNHVQAAQRLGLTEFNTWYVRGLCGRLLAERVVECQAYRGAQPKWEPGECEEHDGQVYPVTDIYHGHRARYWPEPGDPAATSIPFGPGCHHTIRQFTSTEGERVSRPTLP